MQPGSEHSVCCKYTKEEVIERVGKVPFWGQSIPLPYGIMTSGKVMSNLKTIERLKLPSHLAGKRVLDIGAWDGFYSFECEKRGAEVLAIDNLNRMKRPNEIEYASLGNLGFETARDILGSKVDFMDMDVYDLDPDGVGRFDIVLFLGVLYHLKHPVLALEKIGAVAKDVLYIETEWLRGPLVRRPVIQYVESDSYNQDPTNFCRPNTLWLEAVLRDLGFKRIEILYRSSLNRWLMVKHILNMGLLSDGRILVRACR